MIEWGLEWWEPVFQFVLVLGNGQRRQAKLQVSKTLSAAVKKH
jgi:hypothetical protein